MNKKGFTLIDLLSGLVILSIGLLSLAGMQIISISSTHCSANINQATFFAQSELEQLRNLPYDNAALSPGQHNVTAPNTIFSMHYDVAENGVASTKTIAVTVRWTEKNDHIYEGKTSILLKDSAHDFFPTRLLREMQSRSDRCHQFRESSRSISWLDPS